MNFGDGVGASLVGPKSWSPAGNTEVHGALLVFHGNPGKTIFPYFSKVCFAFLVSVLYFGSCCSFLFLFSCLFTVGFRFLCVSPFGIQFVSIFLLWNS